MPYLVIVNRQILLDGPMTFFATLSLYLMARFALTLRPVWLYAAASVLGLTFLAKETSILLHPFAVRRIIAEYGAEALKQIPRVMRPWRGIRVILDGEDGQLTVAHRHDHAGLGRPGGGVAGARRLASD